jgi:phosphopantetheinyl transferase
VGSLGSFHLGLDIAWIDPSIGHGDIYNFTDFLNLSELEWITTQSSPKTGFYMIWSLKEAISKAFGEGLSFGFQRISISIDLLEPFPSIICTKYVNVLIDGITLDWKFHISTSISGYIVAIASQRNLDIQEEFKYLDWRI